jgi:L-amino acid N-acyltransferase YncA
MDYEITTMNDEDGVAVLDIYRQGLATGNATFEMAVPPWEDWDRGHLKHSRLVARDGDEILGWAALSPVSNRCVYGGVGEVSVYVAESGRGRGVGSALLAALIESAEKEGIWTLQAGIFPENEASIKLHLKHGFREVGRRERIGRMNGVWRDTVLLERRSDVVGKD